MPTNNPTSFDDIRKSASDAILMKLDPTTAASLCRARAKAGLPSVLALELKSDPVPVGLFGTEHTSPVLQRRQRSMTKAEHRAMKEERLAEKHFKDSGFCAYDFTPTPTLPIEESYRHDHWSYDRTRTIAAMIMAGRSDARIERFECCGSQAMVKRNTVTGELKVESSHCHDRFCEPCARERSFNVQENLRRQLTGVKFRKITLTLVSSPEPLEDRLKHLLKSLSRLRQQKLWKECVRGGAYAIEVTINKDTGLWHPHLHIVCEGEYMPQADLSACWLRATGDSDYVFIQDGGSSARAAEYAGKYAGKGINLASIPTIEKLAEAILGMNGRRMLSTFGTWRGLVLENNPEQKNSDQWIVIGRLASIFESARRGDNDSIAIIDQLFGVRTEDQCTPTQPPS